MRSDTDLILIEHMAARMKYGKASGGPVAPKRWGGVPYRWASTRLREQEAEASPAEGYVLRIPPMRKLGRAVGRILGGTPLQWVFVLVAFGILALAAIPLNQSSGHEARSSEARAALGAMKDRARVVYERTGKVPKSLEDLGMAPEELNGSYFNAKNYSVTGTSAQNWSATCTGVFNAEPRNLNVTANIINGSASFNR
jgi:type II secretory pathway pseudopilin PulG